MSNSRVDKSVGGAGLQAGQKVYVSVATSAFSGATLLAFLLGAHPQIATVGEMDGLIASEDPDEYLCSCGQKITHCEFWQSVEKAMHAKGFEFSTANFGTRFVRRCPGLIQSLRYGSSRNRFLDAARDAVFQAWPSERQAIELLAARNTAFIQSVLRLTGKDIFLDTSKDRLRLKALHRYSGLDVRAIHWIRDVRGVVASRSRRRSDIDAYTAARDWVKLNQRLQITLQSLPRDRVTVARYEDLCQNVQPTLRRLHRFCGVDPSFETGNFGAVPQHIVGNSMRLGSVAKIVLDERWKSQLSEDQLREIDSAARALRQRYGYT